MGKGGRQLKVVTLNIFSANAGMDVPRIKRQIALLRAHDPDVICLQEAWEDEVVGFFSGAFPHHRVAKASATGLRRSPPVIAYLSSAVATLLCAAFALLPSVAAAASNNPAGWLGILVCAMLALAWCTFPLLAWVPILSPIAIWGLEAGCGVVAKLYASLAVIFAPPVFLWWLGWSGVAPIAGAIQHGDPFGLLVLVRDDAGAAEAGAGAGAGAGAARGAAGAAVAEAQPVLVEAMAYEQQGYIFDGGPWLFWAGWFEATFLFRGAVAIECSLAGGGGGSGAARRVRIVNTHLANGVHNRHRMAQVKELAAFCKPRAAAKRREEGDKAAGRRPGSPGSAGAGAGAGGGGGGGGGGGSSAGGGYAVWSSTADAAGGAGYVQPSATLVCCDSNGDSSEPEMRWLRKSCLSDSFLCHWAKRQPGDDDGGGGGGKGGKGGKEGDEEELREDTPHGGLTWDNANALTHGNLVEPDQRIDFVFLAKGSDGRVVDSAIIGDNPPVSDHYAVMSTFEMDG